MNFLLVLIVALALSGCADSSQTGLDKKVDITVKIDITNSGEGNVTVSPGVDWETATGDTAQESAAVATATAKFKVPIALPGAQSNVESTTEGASATQDNRVEVIKADEIKTKPKIEVNDLEVVSDNDNISSGTDIITDGKVYQTKFDHTNKGAVVLCPDQEMNFDSCSVGGTDIPRHNATTGGDKGRETWMSTTYRPISGDIRCLKGSKEYLYKSGNGVIYGGCSKLEVVEEDITVEGKVYQTKFDHTTNDPQKLKDGGKSLVLCPGQTMNFDKCSSNIVEIPRHSDDNGRETYWSMASAPVGDIVCKKDGKSYRYPASKLMTKGNCN
jgi:hypothetical protein